MNDAQQIVETLLENLDSMEGVPDYDEFFTTAIRNPNGPEARQWNLRNRPPKSQAEATRMGVNWFVKGGRKYTFTQAAAPPSSYQNSRTMATNRNIRRLRFGYRDIYSMRERGWPTAYRRPDGSLRKERQREEPLRYEI